MNRRSHERAFSSPVVASFSCAVVLVLVVGENTEQRIKQAREYHLPIPSQPRDILWVERFFYLQFMGNQ